MQLQPTVTVTEVHYKHTTSVYRVHADISTIFQDIPKPNSTVLVCWCDDVTEALHVLYLQLSAPLPLSLAPIKMANPDSPGKMTVKMERDFGIQIPGFFRNQIMYFQGLFSSKSHLHVAPVRSPSLANQHSVFFTAGCPSCCYSEKTVKANSTVSVND